MEGVLWAGAGSRELLTKNRFKEAVDFFDPERRQFGILRSRFKRGSLARAGSKA